MKDGLNKLILVSLAFVAFTHSVTGQEGIAARPVFFSGPDSLSLPVVKSVDSLSHRYTHKMDSLGRMDLSQEAYVHKVDSLYNKMRDELQALRPGTDTDRGKRILDRADSLVS